MKKLTILLSVWLLVAPGTIERTLADGAIALAVPDDIVAKGVSLGYAINESSPDAAQNAAVASCKRGNAPKDTLALCRVYETFLKRCFAFALDPEESTPGWGWQTDYELLEAERIAMAKCTATEGPDRKGKCRITKSGCDGR